MLADSNAKLLYETHFMKLQLANQTKVTAAGAALKGWVVWQLRAEKGGGWVGYVLLDGFVVGRVSFVCGIPALIRFSDE
jgi:hypothetical protein